MDKNAIALGLQIGSILAGQRRKRVPVACLYGPTQERLPPLPKWDIKTYPYAIIKGQTLGGDTVRRWLYCFDSEPVVNYKGTLLSSVTTTMYMSTNFQEGAGIAFSEPSGFSVMGIDTMVWTNFDLKYENTGDVFFAASEPIPVYE